MFKIYERKDDQDVQYLALIEDEEGVIDLCFVDESGEVCTFILAVKGDGIMLYSGCKDSGIKTERSGHATVKKSP